jgi:hypothetical protein
VSLAVCSQPASGGVIRAVNAKKSTGLILVESDRKAERQGATLLDYPLVFQALQARNVTALVR